MYKDVSERTFRSSKGKIEHTFTHLKNSWKILKCFNFNVPYAGQIIIAYCVLHYFCRMNNEQLASEKIMDAYPNLNNLRVSRKPTSERASRLAALPFNMLFFF